MQLIKDTQNKPAVVFIMGPTASGKTQAAIHLAKKYNVDIINADAAQVYQQMNIGTAKPEPSELADAPHKLIDFVDPTASYSAAQFRIDALREIRNAHDAGKTPVLVGGSMFYFKALEQGLTELPRADKAIRLQIEQQSKEIGWQRMHEALAKIDPQIAQKINTNDPQRIQRALEIHKITGKPPTQVFKENKSSPMPFEAVKIVIAPYSRVILHARIKQRFLNMLNQGLIEEVQNLRQRGDLSLALSSMRTVGYRQVWEYLEGQVSRELMVEKALAATRQLAKRQLTWLRNQSGLVWFVGYNSVDLISLEAYFDK